MEDYNFGKRRRRRDDYEVPDSDEGGSPSRQIEPPAIAQAELSAPPVAAQAAIAAPADPIAVQDIIAALADPVAAQAIIAALADPVAVQAVIAAQAAPSTDAPSSDSDSPPPPRRRRVPRRAENDAVSITDGRLRIDDVPNDVSACLDRLVRQVSRLIKQVQDWMATNPRFGGLAEVRQQLPRLPLNATWTAKHRDRVEKEWLKDPKRVRLLAVAGQKDLLTLYKACLRLVHCLSEDIISCCFNLEYDMDQNRAQARGRSVFWSSPF